PTVPSTDNTVTNPSNTLSGDAQTTEGKETRIPASYLASSENNEVRFTVKIAQSDIENAIKTTQATAANPLQLSLPIPNSVILHQFGNLSVNNVNVDFVLPATVFIDSSIELTQAVLEKEVLEESKETGKDITVSVHDSNGLLRYTWEFTGDNLENSSKELSNVNLALSLATQQTNKGIERLIKQDTNNSQGLVVSLQNSGILPSQANVRLYVGDQKGIKAGQTLYAYYYNEKTTKLDALAGGSTLTVDEKGYVELSLIHCSDYVLVPNQSDAKVSTGLLDQIIVPKYAAVKIDGKKKVYLTLPSTLQIVKDISTATESSAIGAVTVSYSSNNSKIATVNKSSGQITGKSKGKAVITTTVTLFDGSKKVYTTKVTVK
ncbi:MAG TPA: Ig-like domain-containing protein, partial [Lachnospiraceae bacterium]|nr:Ig-like domain-containing protein [Lachnospiraceae bacterium]